MEEYPEGDYRRGDPRFQAQRLGATPAQVALAWLLAEALAKAMPRAQRRTLECQRHLPKPEVLAAALAAFFKA